MMLPFATTATDKPGENCSISLEFKTRSRFSMLKGFNANAEVVGSEGVAANTKLGIALQAANTGNTINIFCKLFIPFPFV
jgi:hypothetical protein